MRHAVLVVDDEEHVLHSIKRLLRRDGYDIHLANGGSAALDILAQEDIAVIICDQRMPGMSGAEVLAEAYRLHPDTVRITLTGYTDLASAQASINEGRVNHFLLKPWDNEHLRSIVRDGVRAYQLVLDNRRLEETTRRQKEELEAWNQKLEEQVEQRTKQLNTRNEQLKNLHDQLEQSLRDTLGVLVGMLEASNPNVGIHSKRVAELARTLGAQLNLPDKDLRDVEFAAHLHDIGKISKLHQERRGRAERRHSRQEGTMMRHSDSGFAILSHVAGFEKIAQAVRHQHENYDGSGYPDHMKEDEIPLASQIIAIAECFDTAVYASTYPTSASRESAKKELLEGRGKRFDSLLVETFIELLARKSDRLCAESEVELSPAQLEAGMKLSRALRKSNGMLLLKGGSVLTSEIIEHVKLASKIDPVLGGVFVRCMPGMKSLKELKAIQDSSSDTERRTSPAASIAASPGQSSERVRILVVDDDAAVANALRRELRRAGWETVCSNDGRAAQNLLEEERFDVVISDVAMPIMCGDMLVAHVAQCWPDLPCIVLTGHANREQLERIVSVPNVVSVLAKPWDSAKLVETISSALKNGTSKNLIGAR